MRNMPCPVCGEDIIFCYKTPTKTFKIEDGGEIKRDDAWQGPEYDNPYLKFYCSNDMEHDIDSKEIIDWSDEVEVIFLSCILPDL
jgi:hypothetical protein